MSGYYVPSDRTSRTAFTAIAATSVSGADPGAGVEASITVPAGEKWILKSFSLVNVQAGAGSTWPVLQITDGTNVIWQAYAGTAAQAVSTTCRFSWAPACPAIIAGATTAVKATGPLPVDLVLGAGYVISTVTVGLSASGDYGIPWASVIKL